MTTVAWPPCCDDCEDPPETQYDHRTDEAYDRWQDGDYEETADVD